MNTQKFYINQKSMISQKVTAALVAHVYSQMGIGLATSLFCAAVIFIGLFSTLKYNAVFYACFGFYLLVTMLRYAFLYAYKQDKIVQTRPAFWAEIYTLGSMLAGISWGLFGIFVFPHIDPLQQAFMILMIAGVTAGAVPLSSAVPRAGIAFLIFTILPFIVTIATLNIIVYCLFDLALSLYLIYNIVLLTRAYELIRNSILLKFENDSLVFNLSEAKTLLEESNKKLELAATHDPLTQVANRNLFNTTLSEAIMTAKAHNKKVALLYMDLDNFKNANDIYGHDVGDQILLEITDRLKLIVGDNNMIARLGGDELTIILQNVTSITEVSKIANKVCEMISLPIKIKDMNIIMSASIGISLYPEDSHDTETLLRLADNSMYYVKMHGGNNFHFCREPVS